jgi:hypothetical protein
MTSSGLSLAIVVAALALFLLWRYREHLARPVKPAQPARCEQESLDPRTRSAKS